MYVVEDVLREHVESFLWRSRRVEVVDLAAERPFKVIDDNRLLVFRN